MMKKSMTKYYTPWFNRNTQVRDIWIDLPRVWRTRTRHIRFYFKQCGTWFRAILGENHFNHLCGKVSRRFLLYTHLNIALLARLVSRLLTKEGCSFTSKSWWYIGRCKGPQNFNSRQNEGALHTLYLDDPGDSWMHENTPGWAVDEVEIVRT